MSHWSKQVIERHELPNFRNRCLNYLQITYLADKLDLVSHLLHDLVQRYLFKAYAALLLVDTLLPISDVNSSH